MTFRLPDILFFLWLLFAAITCFFKEIAEIKFLLLISLVSACYFLGRSATNFEILKKVITLLIFIVAVVCCYYLYADITIFQQHTLVSQNSSIMAIQIAILTSLAIYTFGQTTSRRLKIILFFCIAIFLFLLMLLQSRTAIIALLAALLYIFYPQLRSWYSQKRVLFLAGCLLTIVTFLLALFVKIDSSQSRWFIWKNSFQLFKNNWLTGTGFGLFNPSYNHLQADYFSKHSLTDKNAMLANDGYFAFNEWLHVGVEQGILGILFFMAITLVVLKICFKNIRTKYSFAGLVLILVATASLFSYPLHNWLVLSVTTFFIGIVSTQTAVVCKLKLTARLASAACIITTGFLLFTAYIWLGALIKFERAKDLQEEGYKTNAYDLSIQKKSILKTHPAFTLFYLNLLYETGRLEEAIKWGNEFHKYHCNQKAHAILAKCFAETGNFEEAEKQFYTSLHITPHLLQSRMDFVDFYYYKKDTAKAKYWAQQLIDCPVKIPTDKAWYLKEKAAEYLQRH